MLRSRAGYRSARPIISRSSHSQRTAGPYKGANSGSHSILVARASTWLRWSFGQPGLPLVMPIRTQHRTGLPRGQIKG